MTLEQLFSTASGIAMLAWLGLILAPRSRWTNYTIHRHIIPLILSVGYVVLVILFFGQSEGSFGSLKGVMQLFSHPGNTLMGWVHYLAFDLFIGGWEARNAEEKGIPHLLMIPIYVATFMLGPVGFVAFLALSSWWGNSHKKVISSEMNAKEDFA